MESDDDSSSDTTDHPSYQNVEVRKAHFRYGDKVASRRSKRERDIYQNVSFDSSTPSSNRDGCLDKKKEMGLRLREQIS